MEAVGNVFNLIFVGPIINLLVGIFQGLQYLHIPGALGFSIISLTLLIRFLAWPLMSSQIKATRKMADLKPHLDELKHKHKDDKQAFAAAQMALYKEHGVNPAGGCLPALIQVPIFIALYQSIINIIPGPRSSVDHINSLLYFKNLNLSQHIDSNFFGIALGVRPFDFAKYGLWLLLIPLLTATLTFIQSKMTMPAKPLKIYKEDKPKEIKEKENMEDSMSAVQSQMIYLMPVMIGYFALQFPVGLALYWNTYTILGIIQQHRLTGWGSFESLINMVKSRGK